jgi:putative ABC transport system permease protein
MNIMLVSVRERTVEIGLRKALGALQLDLLYQFVVEALLLCGLGGIGGWAAGFGGVRLLQHYGVQATPLPGALGVALAAAAGVGVLFGTYPAYLASELEPVEALRRQ